MRKRHPPESKAEAAVETSKAEEPLNQIASGIEAHPGMRSVGRPNAAEEVTAVYRRRKKQYSRCFMSREICEILQIGFG